jgi:hypothetical protein
VAKLNEDMEPFRLLSVRTWKLLPPSNNADLHYQNNLRSLKIKTEHAPLLTFIKTKDIQRDLFIAKLTSNDIEMDIKLAERTGRHLA